MHEGSGLGAKLLVAGIALERLVALEWAANFAALTIRATGPVGPAAFDQIING